jgi:hypothetical protein
VAANLHPEAPSGGGLERGPGVDPLRWTQLDCVASRNQSLFTKTGSNRAAAMAFVCLSADSRPEEGPLPALEFVGREPGSCARRNPALTVQEPQPPIRLALRASALGEFTFLPPIVVPTALSASCPCQPLWLPFIICQTTVEANRERFKGSYATYRDLA